MVFDPANYPPDWKELGKLVRERVGNRCEQCGVPNGERGARDDRGRWHAESEIDGMNSTEGFQLWRDGYPDLIKIVLTVHHACGCDKRTCRDIAHWQLLCQRCHLNADRDHHLAVQKANRLAKKLAAPLPLFDGVSR